MKEKYVVEMFDDWGDLMPVFYGTLEECENFVDNSNADSDWFMIKKIEKNS